MRHRRCPSSSRPHSRHGSSGSNSSSVPHTSSVSVLLSLVVVVVAVSAASAAPAADGKAASRVKRQILPVEAAAAIARRQALASAEAGLGGSSKLAHFLSRFVLIKTPHGYILGRNRDRRAEEEDEAEDEDEGVRASNMSEEAERTEEEEPMAARERRLPSLAESNFQLRVRKAPQAERNFQLRVRKRGMSLSPLAENNFQLRVRKSPQMERNFQLRVRRGFPGAAESNFQLRVRRFPSAENNFQLRVRKRGVMQTPAFPRVRKPSLAERNFQLRVRKRAMHDNDDEQDQDGSPGLHSLQDYLDRFKLMRTSDGAYILHEMEKRAAEGVDFLDEDVAEE